MSAVAATGATRAPAARPAAAKTLGQSDFLKLLTTQLNTQDPFNPVDNSQMIAQMAQFSQVSGIAQMNSSLSSIAALLARGQSADLSGWIGRAALVNSDSIVPHPDGSYQGDLTLDAATPGATLELSDASGTVVHREALGDRPAGTIAFAWTPPADAGVTGPLHAILTSNGAPVRAALRSWVLISAIIAPAAGADSRLATPLGEIDPASVKRLS